MSVYVIQVKFEAANDDNATHLAKALSDRAMKVQEVDIVSKAEIAITKIEDAPNAGE